jgi:hypothetical protein
METTVNTPTITATKYEIPFEEVIEFCKTWLDRIPVKEEYYNTPIEYIEDELPSVSGFTKVRIRENTYVLCSERTDVTVVILPEPIYIISAFRLAHYHRQGYKHSLTIYTKTK